MMRRGLVTFLVLVLVTAAPAYAETVANAQKTVNLELKDVDIRSALDAVFKIGDKNYSVDSNVTGSVPSISLKDVPFDTALRSLTRSAGLVYRVDSAGGKEVYIVSKRTEPPAYTPSPPVNNPGDYPNDPVTTEREVRIEKVPLQYTGATEMLAMLGGGGRDFGSIGYGGYGGGGYGGYGMNNMGGGMGGYGMGNMGGGYGGYGMNNMGGGYGGYGGSRYGGSNYGNYGGYGGYGNGGYNSGYGGGYGSRYGGTGGTSIYRGW